MRLTNRWAWAAAIGLPLVTLTAYLLWVWPRPRGDSFIAQVGPYVLSLLTGLPFLLRVGGRSGRWVLLFVFLVGGFLVLWIYALAVLCGARGVCL